MNVNLLASFCERSGLIGPPERKGSVTKDKYCRRGDGWRGEGAQRDDEQEIVRGTNSSQLLCGRGCVAGCWPNAPDKRSERRGSGENQERDDAIVS